MRSLDSGLDSSIGSVSTVSVDRMHEAVNEAEEVLALLAARVTASGPTAMNSEGAAEAESKVEVAVENGAVFKVEAERKFEAEGEAVCQTNAGGMIVAKEEADCIAEDRASRKVTTEGKVKAKSVTRPRAAYPVEAQDAPSSSARKVRADRMQELKVKAALGGVKVSAYFL